MMTTTTAAPLEKPRHVHSQVLMNSIPNIFQRIVAETHPTKIEPSETTTETKDWSVQRMPVFYPLARSSLTIPSAISLESIVIRMTVFLRMRSIKCKFHPQSGRVDCLHSGSSMVKFVLQLWRNESDASSFVLEVQLRRGCSMEMRSLCRDLFHAVVNGQHKHRQQHEPTTNSNHACDEKLVVVKTQKQKQRRPKLTRSNNTSCSKLTVNDTMRNCLQLLDSPFQEQNKLGMESLQNSTNSTIVGPELAKSVSKAVLLGEGEFGEHIRDHLVRWIVITAATVVPQEDHHHNYDAPTEEEEDDDVVEMFHSNTMESLALEVLANALQETEEIPQILLSSRSSLEDVTRCLTNNVEMALDRPEQAAISAQCLRFLSFGEQKGMSSTFEDVLCFGSSFMVKAVNDHYRKNLKASWEVFLNSATNVCIL